MQKFLEKLEIYILYGLVFVLPLTALSVFPDPFGIPKLAILAIGVTLVLIVKSIALITNHRLSYATSNFDVPLLIIVVGYIASAVFTSSNKMEAFFYPGTASAVIASFILYLLLNNLNLTQKNLVKLIIFLSAILVSLATILSASGALNSIPQISKAFGNKLSLPGGVIPEIIFLAVVLPICIELVVTTKDFAKRTFLAMGGIIVILSLVLTVVSILPGKPDALTLPSLQTSLSVVFDTLKESPLFGAGPGNYLSAFNRFRPIDYNSTPLWQVRFTTANDFYLTAITETGLIGLTGLVLLFVAAVKLARKIKPSESHLTAFLVIVLGLFLLPANGFIISVLFILAALAGSTKKNEVEIPGNLKLVSYIIAVPVIIGVAVLYFFSYRAVSAEAVFKNSIESVAGGDGKKTYDLMRTAITLNPYVDRYHAAYAQTNMALAQSLASQKDLKDSDKQTISTLIQQAIREGKSTVLLNQTRSGNWELLAKIYQAIMPFAQGADQFTLQTYSQAIALDPINPNLRIALGGVYFGLGKFETAIDVFKLAVAAKPDLANSHYNLSAGYREKGEYENAITEMEAVLQLVAKDSPDYQTASKELEALKKKAPVKSTTQTNQLTAPQKTQTVIKPPLELPQEATPPATTTP